MTEAWTAGRTAPDARLRDLPTDVAQLPMLPSAFGRTLDEGLAGLGVELAPAARAAIEAHVRLLLAWNEAINLTAITDPAAIAGRHVLDSLAALPLLADAEPERSGSLDIVDLGSGGGFPGLPLAAVLPRSRVTLVDSIRKKARFLEVAAGAAGLADRVEARAERAEALAGRGGSWDVVTARAVGSLADLVELALPLLRVGGRLVAWKRGDIAAELDAAARAARALRGGPPIVRAVEAVANLRGHVLITVSKLGRTPPGHPRDPARRSRQPW